MLVDDPWQRCVGFGCTLLDVTNADTHTYPWLASCVSVTLLVAFACSYLYFAAVLQGSLVRVRPGQGGG